MQVRGRGLSGRETATRTDGRPGRRPLHQAAQRGGVTRATHRPISHSPLASARLRPNHHDQGHRGVRYVTNIRKGLGLASHNKRYIKSAPELTALSEAELT